MLVNWLYESNTIKTFIELDLTPRQGGQTTQQQRRRQQQQQCDRQSDSQVAAVPLNQLLA